MIGMENDRNGNAYSYLSPIYRLFVRFICHYVSLTREFDDHESLRWSHHKIMVIGKMYLWSLRALTAITMSITFKIKKILGNYKSNYAHDEKYWHDSNTYLSVTWKLSLSSYRCEIVNDFLFLLLVRWGSSFKQSWN